MREHKLNNQSAANKTFEKKRHVNKMNEQAETSPNNNAIKFKLRKELPLRHLQTSQTSSAEEMDRDYFHWGATTEIMETIRRREKSPETKRLVERRLEIARPGMTRRRYDQNARSKMIKSREEIAEIDGELIQRANSLGGDWEEAINQCKRRNKCGTKSKRKSNRWKTEQMTRKVKERVKSSTETIYQSSS